MLSYIRMWKMVLSTIVAAFVLLTTQSHTDLWWEACAFVHTGQMRADPVTPNSTFVQPGF